MPVPAHARSQVRANPNLRTGMLWVPPAITRRNLVPKKIFFLGKNVADPTIKSQNFLPNLKYQLKIKYPPLAKNWLQKDTIQLSHMSFTTSVTRVCASAILHSLKPCCLHMYFLWRHHLPPDTYWKMIKMVTLIDLHIVLTYDCLTLLVNLQCLSIAYRRGDGCETIRMTI
jgi:hypothetical protein